MTRGLRAVPARSGVRGRPIEPKAPGIGTRDDPSRTAWRIADERVELLAGALTWLVWPFEIVEGEELRRFTRGFVNRVRA